MSYQTSSGWSPLCGLDAANQPIQAVSVAGVWTAVSGDSARYSASTTQFTLACRARTIAKCVELGYKTYNGYTTQLTTCVRLLRGDYCGSGNANTVDGTTLNLYDNVGVQADTQTWVAEAEWTPSGARCINSQNKRTLRARAVQGPQVREGHRDRDLRLGLHQRRVLIDELPQRFQAQTTK